MEENRERERLFRDWRELLRLCAEHHAKEMKGKAGAAVVCICGQGCGGSGPCSVLGQLRSLIIYMPTKGLTKPWRDAIELWRSIV